jgi:hypothetical protein
MADTYSIINILGTTTYLNESVINIFNKIDLSDINTNINFYDDYSLTNSARWDLISTKFYGSPNLWWLLAAFNGVKDPFQYLKENERIKIIKAEAIPSLLLKLKGYA